MHIYFSGIGGTAIGPLAQIAKQAGYDVSGSDEKHSQYIDYLKSRGIPEISIGQSEENIAAVHRRRPIDWFVYSSAVSRDSSELTFCRQNNIKVSKRDELLNKIIDDRGLKLVAIAGTHGKTTTCAMAIWLFKELGIPVSYSVGTKLSFGDMGVFDPKSEYFIYECDEFDRNFLAFHPQISLITGVSWDHHEIYETQEEYSDAFRQFLGQSEQQLVWKSDAELLELDATGSQHILDEKSPEIDNVRLAGLYNRRDAYLVARATHQLTKKPMPELLNLLSNFPGVSRRFEKIIKNLYTDYAHTPEKIIGAMSVAKESLSPGQKLVVVYEPLTNRRMHYTKELHRNIFNGADAIYWVPSYLAREDPGQSVLAPFQLIKSLSPQLQGIAKPAELNGELKDNLARHLAGGDLVLCLSGGGGGSLDEWVREKFDTKDQEPNH